MQLQEIQAIESSFQHIYDGGELRNKSQGLVQDWGRETTVREASFRSPCYRLNKEATSQELKGSPQKHICGDKPNDVFCLLKYLGKKMEESYKNK